MEHLGASAAGVAVHDRRWGLRTLASCPEPTALDGLFQSHPADGPAVEVLAEGRAVTADLAASVERWPGFAPAARAVGHSHVLALPIRMDGATVGALGVFRDTGPWSEQDPVAGQVLADIAALALVQEAAHRRGERAAERVQGLLNDRGTVEQAKGAIAAYLACGVDEAHRILTDVAGRLATSPLRLAHRVLTGEETALAALTAARRSEAAAPDSEAGGRRSPGPE